MPHAIDRRSMLAAAAVGGVALASTGAGAQSRAADGSRDSGQSSRSSRRAKAGRVDLDANSGA